MAKKVPDSPEQEPTVRKRPAHHFLLACLILLCLIILIASLLTIFQQTPYDATLIPVSPFAALAAVILSTLSIILSLRSRAHIGTTLEELVGDARKRRRPTAPSDAIALSGIMNVIAILAGLGAVTLLFSCALYFIVNSPIPKLATATDSSALLLSAASLALFVFSSFVAIAGIFGWQQLQRTIEAKVSERFLLSQLGNDKKLDALENELRGRTASLTGFMLGELSFDYSSDGIKIGRPDLLEASVIYCRDGFSRLRYSETPDARMFALNNYLFYHSLTNMRPLSPAMIDAAEDLRTTGLEKNLPYLQLTYCRTIAIYSPSQAKKREAGKIVRGLISRNVLDSRQVKEAEACLKLLNSW